jgi:hypothetical protein
LYERKQQECREGRVNLVEIDLLRSGAWALAIPEQLVPASHRGPHRVSVYRAHDSGSLGEVYRVPLRERLHRSKFLPQQSRLDAAGRSAGDFGAAA